MMSVETTQPDETKRKSSHTALGVAWLRAAHQVLEEAPRILEDPVSLVIIGEKTAEKIAAVPSKFSSPERTYLRSHVVLRSRYCEDRLAVAVKERGIRQYVLLGAGFDTFAFRQPSWGNSVQIFEVDQPSSQATKRQHLDRASLSTPPNVHFVAIDFEAEPLESGLRRGGVSFDQPTFFSWLGVSMYLTEAAIDHTLRTIALFPRGSEVALTSAHRIGRTLRWLLKSRMW